MMTMNANLDVRAIEELVTRIDAQLSGPNGKVIGFVASGSGEGTTTLVRAYAGAVLSRLQRRVLVLGCDNAAARPGVLAALVAGSPLEDCLRPLPGGGFIGSLGGTDQAMWELLVRADLWDALRARFDSIVLDLPATSVSRVAMVTAPHCDGVVVVLEAEKTRAPVVENLIANLRSVGANLLGTVLNRRRYYLPQRVYQWL